MNHNLNKLNLNNHVTNRSKIYKHNIIYILVYCYDKYLLNIFLKHLLNYLKIRNIF